MSLFEGRSREGSVSVDSGHELSAEIAIIGESCFLIELPGEIGAIDSAFQVGSAPEVRSSDAGSGSGDQLSEEGTCLLEVF